MSYLAAVLLLNMEVFPAFQVLANMLNGPLYQRFFRFQTEEIDIYFSVFEEQMKKQLPQVYNNLKEKSITPHMYAMDWYVVF